MDSHTTSRIEISGELNIYTAAEWREKLLTALAEEKDIELDLSEVSEIDSAGLQLLIASKREAESHNRGFSLNQHSQAVRELLDLCRLESYFGDPVVIPASNA